VSDAFWAATATIGTVLIVTIAGLIEKRMAFLTAKASADAAKAAAESAATIAAATIKNLNGGYPKPPGLNGK